MAISATKAVVVKNLLLGVLLLLLIFPTLQAKWNIINTRPLDGHFEPASSPEEITWSGLKGNSYQEQLEHYLNDHLGFREWFIRLRNQVDYTLFKRLHTNDVILGENGVLFQGSHIMSYQGQDFIGEEEVKFYVHRMRLIQDKLAQQGTQFLYMLAPGKPRYQPEDLPEFVKAGWTRTTNYAAFAQELGAAGVHTLDAVQLFQRWKRTVPHPLFPRGGTHWSGYSITLVADTLFRQLEIMGNYDLPDFQSSPGVVTSNSKDLRFTDADIAKSLNLIWDPKPYPTAYPTITFEPVKSGQHKADMLLVGDSFTQSLYGFYPYLSKLLNTRSRFWYYNEVIFWPETLPTNAERNVHKLNLGEQLKGRDAVVLVATEQNMNRSGFGFVDDVYHFYYPYTAADTVRLEQIKHDITQSPSWHEKVMKQAEVQQVSFEEALAREAYYMRERER